MSCFDRPGWTRSKILRESIHHLILLTLVHISATKEAHSFIPAALEYCPADPVLENHSFEEVDLSAFLDYNPIESIKTGNYIPIDISPTSNQEAVFSQIATHSWKFLSRDEEFLETPMGRLSYRIERLLNAKFDSDESKSNYDSRSSAGVKLSDDDWSQSDAALRSQSEAALRTSDGTSLRSSGGGAAKSSLGRFKFQLKPLTSEARLSYSRKNSFEANLVFDVGDSRLRLELGRPLGDSTRVVLTHTEDANGRYEGVSLRWTW